jgi:hypothetical protein
MNSYSANLTEIFSGAAAALDDRWSAASFFDKVAFAHRSVPPQYWPGYGYCKPIPGLPSDERWAGVTEVQGHLVGWRGNRLRWSAANDFSTWIPIGATAAALRLTLCNGFQQPATGNMTGWLWVQEPPDGLVAETYVRIEQGGAHNFYSVAEVSKRGDGLAGQLAAASGDLMPGATAMLTLQAPPQRWVQGSRVFIGGQTVPLRITAVSLMETLPPTLTVVNEGTVPVAAGNGAAVAEAHGLRLTNLGLTGALAAGTVITGQIVTEVANDAGELANVGGDINGDIWGVAAVNGNALILKEWSVQTLVYAGRPAVWQVSPLLAGEGLLGKYAWTKLQGGALFVGHREILRYNSEGLNPVMQQHSRQFFAELDRARLDEINLFEHEGRNEVWIIYPVANGARRVLVWNWLEDSVTADDYEGESVTAGAMMDWQTDVGWDDLAAAWDDTTQTWGDLGHGQRERLLLIALQDGGPPRLAVHGLDYARDGRPYRCMAETLLFDGGDDYVFKYGDSVKVNLQIKARLPRPKRLWCQLGARESLDSDTVWSGAEWVEVSGNTNPVAKFDLCASGRFLQVRLFSEQTDAQWRVAGLEINGRRGNAY